MHHIHFLSQLYQQQTLSFSLDPTHKFPETIGEGTHWQCVLNIPNALSYTYHSNAGLRNSLVSLSNSGVDAEANHTGTENLFMGNWCFSTHGQASSSLLGPSAQLALLSTYSYQILHCKNAHISATAVAIRSTTGLPEAPLTMPASTFALSSQQRLPQIP